MSVTTKPVMRFVLDVNVLMSTIEYTGPVTDIQQLADMSVPSSHPARNQMHIVKGVAQAIIARKAPYQLHVTEHVLDTLEYKLGEWAGRRSGWDTEAVITTIEVLFKGIESMIDSGWTATTAGERHRSALDTVVPADMRSNKCDIDNEDRLVLLDMVAVSQLAEWDDIPTVTMLVTNDGGLQAANEYVQKNYTGFAAAALPQSVMIVLPSTVAKFFRSGH